MYKMLFRYPKKGRPRCVVELGKFSDSPNTRYFEFLLDNYRMELEVSLDESDKLVKFIPSFVRAVSNNRLAKVHAYLGETVFEYADSGSTVRCSVDTTAIISK